MQQDLFQARETLKNSLLRNAEIVVEEILHANLHHLIEIGIFGSLAKDTFTCASDSDIYLLFEGDLPDRKVKGHLRSIAEENHCDLLFLESTRIGEAHFPLHEALKKRIVLWRRGESDDQK